jgi:hypothetical protein
MVPHQALAPDDYIRQRLQHQREWYSDRAHYHRRKHILLWLLVTVTNLGAALLGYFELIVWSPVVMTFVGALTTYSALCCSDYLASSYRNTARHLDDLEKAWNQGAYGSGPDAFHRLVMHVEHVIAREYSGWLAEMRHIVDGK